MIRNKNYDNYLKILAKSTTNRLKRIDGGELTIIFIATIFY